MGKKRLVVLFGGQSGEHEVSLNSAASVIGAFDKSKYEVLPVAITREGRWVAGISPERMAGGDNPLEIAGKEVGVEVVFLPGDPTVQNLVVPGKGEYWQDGGKIDAIFPVLHGTYGEDGTVQGLLEITNIPYVGSGVLGSAVGMDKVLMKTILAQHNLPQIKFFSCLRKDLEKNLDSVVKEAENSLGYPCFVKPANMGSSVGISKAHNKEELIVSLSLAAKYDRKIILEEFIEGREIEVSVLGNDSPIASVPGEIIPLKEFYDYEAKYADGFSNLEIPADLPEVTIKQLRELAIKVFTALDCAGMGRVDFFVAKSDGRVVVNEINTIPGFTKFSMYPKLWEASGLKYSELLDRLIELAVDRQRDKNLSQTVFKD
ncbi:MAG: D-alanine--D-alanine ligase [Peptococcaceae bacterium]|nr:D-alanine--D-alanine ligase [Peptococcaceae bacterium]